MRWIQEIINRKKLPTLGRRRLIIKGVIDSFYLSRSVQYYLKSKVPDKYIGKTLHDIDVRHNHRVLVLTIIRYKKIRGALRANQVKRSVLLGVVDIPTVLEEDDILVMFGDMKHISQFGVS